MWCCGGYASVKVDMVLPPAVLSPSDRPPYLMSIGVSFHAVAVVLLLAVCMCRGVAEWWLQYTPQNCVQE